jgi:hypothetical protein
MHALAISNSDLVYLHWRVDRKISGCLGFTIDRADAATERVGR